MFTPCWDTSMNSGVRCLAVLKTILPILNPMVTSLSIQRFMGQKDLLKSKSVPRKCTKLPNMGVAAHWAYKKGIKGKVDSKESALGMNWIKDLVELQDASNGDAMGFVDSVKEDIFSERIYVFTPNGAVQELPKDSGLLTLPMPSIPS